MDLALNNLQKLICHKAPTKQPTKYYIIFLLITELINYLNFWHLSTKISSIVWVYSRVLFLKLIPSPQFKGGGLGLSTLCLRCPVRKMTKKALAISNAMYFNLGLLVSKNSFVLNLNKWINTLEDPGKWHSSVSLDLNILNFILWHWIYLKTFLNGSFINFLIRIWHLGLFYVLMETLKE